MSETVPSSVVATPELQAPRAELSFRTIAVGVVVAVLVGSAYPYIVLKVGFGPTVSVLSAFLAFIGLNLVSLVTRKKSNRFEYNMVQTAGTASAQAAFMCVVLAAFDMLAAKPELGFMIRVSPIQVFLWMSVAGLLGVLLAVPLRKHYIDEENLTFADGTAAGESLVLLDSEPAQAGKRVKVLALAGVFSALVTWFRDGKPVFIPGALFYNDPQKALRIGLSLSALEFGSGLIVGLRITLSMALGMAIAWFLLPGYLHGNGWIPAADFNTTLRWVMWPATGLMVSGGLTALALKWKLVAKTFKDLASGKLASGNDFPMRWVVVGSVTLATALVILQWWSMGVAIWESVLAILVSIVLMLVGIRVLGETNWAPISAMANMVQGVFALVSPGSIGVNMVASGMSGTVAGAGEHLMQDFKAGKIIGNQNRSLTYMQLIATPIGAAAIAIVYPLLRAKYGIGADRYGGDPAMMSGTDSGLTSPISVKWAGFAELLKEGVSKLPPYTAHALVAAVVVGIVITVLEEKHKKWLPSPTGMALGMLIPAMHVLPMLMGGLVQWAWNKKNPKHEEAYSTPLASGFIVGEALLALIIAFLGFFGLLGGGGH